MKIELVVTGPNDGVAIIELDATDSTAEDILVLSEVQLGVPCAGLAVEVENPESGVFKPLNMQNSLASQGVSNGASVRLVANSNTVSQLPSSSTAPSQPVSQPAVQSPPRQQAPMSPEDLIRHLMSGGGGAGVSATGRNQHHQPIQEPIDPMDPEYQRKLYEQIQQENVLHNMAQAMEHTPEAFARVIMLYVKASCNQKEVTAFIDSGAQMTIMNEETATRCGIMHLLDRRFAGTAKGVGTSKILGRIHMAMVKIGPIVVPMSISVLEGQDMSFLIGLDQLRRHQMCIDLKKNVLRIGDDVEVPFLQEGELPDHLTNRMREEAEAMSRANSQA